MSSADFWTHVGTAEKDGSNEALDGRWTVLWEKRGEDWLVLHKHISVPLESLPVKQ